MQLQQRSGTLNAVSGVFRAGNVNDTSLINPYSSDQTVLAGLLADESLTVFVSGHHSSPRSEPIPLAGAQPIIFAENWEKEDDLRFDLLVEKEALGDVSLEEEEELERLSNKRDRTVVRVSDEDLSRERMRNRALTELQELLEKYAPLLARRT
jgi:hypothetical protein